MFLRSAVIMVAELPLKLTCVTLVSDPRSDLTCLQAAADAVPAGPGELADGDADAGVLGWGTELALAAGLDEPAGLTVLLVDDEVVHAARSTVAPTIGTATGTVIDAAALHQVLAPDPDHGACLGMELWFPCAAPAAPP